MLERTEVHVPDVTGRPRRYFLEQLVRAFAPEPGPLMALPPAPADTGANTPAVNPPISATPRHDGGLAIGSLSIENAMSAIRRGERWHDHVVRLIAHWTARGWTDAEIQATAEGLTLPGWTHDQTRRDLARMIDGARRKWNVPNPSHELEETNAPPPMGLAWIEKVNAAMIHNRRWLVGSFAIRGHVTVLVAPPGAGKSTLALSIAVAAVTGRSEIVGETVHEPVKAWVYNNEDDRDELHRRLAAIMQRWNIPVEEIRFRLALNSGVDRPLIVARANRDGTVARLPDLSEISNLVEKGQIDLLIVDPFVETHEVNENDNAQIKAVATFWRELAHRMNCAVVLVHHSGKPPAAAPDAWVGSMSASRGASALAGVARIMRTLFGMSNRDAAKLGVEEEDRHRWVRLDDAKANLSLAAANAKWFRRESVTIANGDEVGVLVPGDPKPPEDAKPDEEAEAAVIAEIDRAWRVGEPYGVRSQSKRYFGKLLPGRLGRAANAVRTTVLALLDRGVIEDAVYDTRDKARGLRVVPFGERRMPTPNNPPDSDGER